MFSNLPRPTQHVIGSGDIELTVRHYRPNAALAPAVILAPGGIATGSLDSIDWAASRFAAAGFHALSITYRGGSPEHDPLDIRLAFDWLAARADVAIYQRVEIGRAHV